MRQPFDATGTIGSLPCEVSLNQILAERDDPKLIKKVTKLLHTMRSRIKQLEFIPDKSARAHFRILLKRDAEAAVSEITGVAVRGVPVLESVASHTMCCLHAYFAPKGKPNASHGTADLGR